VKPSVVPDYAPSAGRNETACSPNDKAQIETLEHVKNRLSAAGFFCCVQIPQRPVSNGHYHRACLPHLSLVALHADGIDETQQLSAESPLLWLNLAHVRLNDDGSLNELWLARTRLLFGFRLPLALLLSGFFDAVLVGLLGHHFFKVIEQYGALMLGE
jgi:hypothetical protein